MNLRFLRTIVAVSQHQSLNAAARSLGLSHSAVSLQIKALEEELQFPILDRTRRPPVLTGEGLALVEHARRMDDIAGDIRSLADGRRLRGRVTVGAVPSTISNLAAPALAAIYAGNPDLTIELQSALSQRLIDLVGDGTLDVALVTDPGAGSGDLAIAPICSEPFQVIASAGEAMDDPDALLSARPFVWFDRRSRLSQQVDAFLSARRIRVTSAMEVDSFEAVEALVRHGLGVSILPRRVLSGEPEGLERRTLSLDLLERRVVLVSRTASARQVFAARFAETLRTAVAGG